MKSSIWLRPAQDVNRPLSGLSTCPCPAHPSLFQSSDPPGRPHSAVFTSPLFHLAEAPGCESRDAGTSHMPTRSLKVLPSNEKMYVCVGKNSMCRFATLQLQASSGMSWNVRPVEKGVPLCLVACVANHGFLRNGGLSWDRKISRSYQAKEFFMQREQNTHRALLRGHMACGRTLQEAGVQGSRAWCGVRQKKAALDHTGPYGSSGLNPKAQESPWVSEPQREA